MFYNFQGWCQILPILLTSTTLYLISSDICSSIFLRPHPFKTNEIGKFKNARTQFSNTMPEKNRPQRLDTPWIKNSPGLEGSRRVWSPPPPKPLSFVFVDTLWDPFGSKSHTTFIALELLFDDLALHGLIWLDFSTEKFHWFVHCFLMSCLVDFDMLWYLFRSRTRPSKSSKTIFLQWISSAS